MIKNSPLRSLAITLLLVVPSLTTTGQDFTWQSIPEKFINAPQEQILINASKADYYQIDFESLSTAILNADDGTILKIPMPGGEEKRFVLKENTTMPPGLNERYPTIRAFNIISEESRNTWGKMDVTPSGFRALIFEPGKSAVYIDPVVRGNTDFYIVYRSKDFVSDNVAFCEVGGHHELVKDALQSTTRGSDYNDCEFSTYIIAVGTTAEFTAFHGGTVEGGLAAVVSTVNRVNGVWEIDFATTTTLSEDNDAVIFLDPDTDGYTNNNNGLLLEENQTNLDQNIGFDSYDIGHVFATNGGGLAQLGTSCQVGVKARCMSGNQNFAVGDPFAIRLVCHEMGHQFEATHSFNNSCNGNRTIETAVEPGSGSSIMSYAAVCAPNVQNFTDDHYHGISMEQIGAQINQNTCQVTTSIDNLAPLLADLPDLIVIPAGTPFALTAQATDLDGDILTYCWEQMDNEVIEHPPSPDEIQGTVFRSRPPSLSPTRYFPALPDVQSTTWEVLPNGFRFDMHFRVSVRDNSPEGSCTQYAEMTVAVNDDGGPFILEYPSANGIVWDAFTNETVVWDVANTDDEEFNGEFVDIFLSTDGGLGYPILLADDIPNNGSFEIEVPSIPTSTARIMVMNSAGTFFDVSNNNFTITGIASGFELNIADDFFVCQGEDAIYTVDVAAAFGFNEQINLSLANLPSGVNGQFADETLMAGESTTLTISNTSNAPLGLSAIQVQGVAGEFDFTAEVNLNINEPNPAPIDLVSPENAVSDIGAISTFTWVESESALTSYELEMAFDAEFNELYAVFSNIPTNTFQVEGLPLESELFWRVREDNGCGIGVSEVRSFSTSSCQLRISQDIPVTIPAIAGTHESELQVDQPGIIERIRLTNLVGTHGRVSDLTISIISPQGTELTLFSEICGDNDDFNLSFEDGGIPDIDCPPTTTSFYAPEGDLSDFNGEEASGTWTLKIVDSANSGGGELEGWQLELCYEGSILSASSESSSSIKIFPNPTNGLVQIDLGEMRFYNRIQVRDAGGRLVDEIMIREEERLKNIDLSFNASGVYFLSFLGEGVGESLKILKVE